MNKYALKDNNLVLDAPPKKYVLRVKDLEEEEKRANIKKLKSDLLYLQKNYRIIKKK